MYIEVHRHWAAKYAKNTTLSWIQAPVRKQPFGVNLMQSVSLSQRRTTGILPQRRYEKNKVELNLRRWEREFRALRGRW